MEAQRTPDANREFALLRDDRQHSAVTGFKREAISPELVSRPLASIHCFQLGPFIWGKFAPGFVEKFENIF